MNTITMSNVVMLSKDHRPKTNYALIYYSLKSKIFSELIFVEDVIVPTDCIISKNTFE
jgi:hypothetical protein